MMPVLVEGLNGWLTQVLLDLQQAECTIAKPMVHGLVKTLKMYKQTWGGNGFTGGKNKFGKSTSNAIKWGGRIFGVYSGYKTIEQRLNGEIGTIWMVSELGTTGISTFGGPG
jgi:hypothetical protein